MHCSKQQKNVLIKVMGPTSLKNSWCDHPTHNLQKAMYKAERSLLKGLGRRHDNELVPGWGTNVDQSSFSCMMFYHLFYLYFKDTFSTEVYRGLYELPVLPSLFFFKYCVLMESALNCFGMFAFIFLPLYFIISIMFPLEMTPFNLQEKNLLCETRLLTLTAKQIPGAVFAFRGHKIKLSQGNIFSFLFFQFFYLRPCLFKCKG